MIVTGVAPTDADCVDPLTGMDAYRLILDDVFTWSIKEPVMSEVDKVKPVTIVNEGGALTPWINIETKVPLATLIASESKIYN